MQYQKIPIFNKQKWEKVGKFSLFRTPSLPIGNFQLFFFWNPSLSRKKTFGYCRQEYLLSTVTFYKVVYYVHKNIYDKIDLICAKMGPITIRVKFQNVFEVYALS